MKKTLYLAAVISITVFACSKDSTETTPTPSTPTTGTGGGTGGGGTGGGTGEPEDSTSYATYSFNAQINDSESPNAEVSSYLDDNNNTHIAWIKDDGNTRDVMYTVFNNSSKSFSTQTVEFGVVDEKPIAPEIITDNSNNPHIVFIKKRDINSGINNGNYAVMYAHSSGGGFTVEQVSTNPTDPSAEDEGLYNCAVNGRPSVFLDDNVIKVSYQADANTNTSWNNYQIIATRNGSSWTRQQMLDIDATFGNDNPDRGFSFPQYSTGELHAGYIDISNYEPHFVTESAGWSKTTIPGLGGALGTNRHIQVEQDYHGTTHLSWFNNDNDKFYHTTLTGSSYGTLDEVSIQNSKDGNFQPVAIDRAYGDFYMVYFDFSANAYFISYDFEANDGSYIETKIDESEIGVVYGRRCFFMYDDYFSFTTASETDGKIYVTVPSE